MFFFYKWSFGEKLSERTDRGVCDGFVAFNKHPDVNDFVIVSAFNRHLYGKTIREMKKNPICFSSQRIKSKQFIKNGKAIIASKTIIPTCANDIKFLLPNFNPRLPNFTIGKSYDKVNCFDDVGAKQTIIDILQTKLNDLGKAHDFMDDDYEQLKKKYVKLKKKQVKEMLSQKKTEKIAENEIRDVSDRYNVCYFLFVVFCVDFVNCVSILSILFLPNRNCFVVQ